MELYIKVVCLAMVFVLSAFFNSFPQSRERDEFQTSKFGRTLNNFNTGKAIATYDSTALDSFILATMNTYNIPGVQACIVKKDQIVWKGAYGYAHIAQNRPVTDSTLFYIASISKTVTATALMQLWERGSFGLNDDINNYLPFPVRNPNHPNTPITFRMLLTHTSSIHDNDGIIEPLLVMGDSPIPLDSILENYLVPGGTYWSSGNYNSFSPGQQWDYSNIGGSLIGYLVERISNNSFEQYCQDSIFIPLGMNETSYFLANLDTNHIAMPYGPGGQPFGYYSHPLYPTATLKTSAIQLSRFLRSYIQMGQSEGVRILDSATVDLITNKHLFVNDPIFPFWQGLIWEIYNWALPHLGAPLLCAHTGLWHGVETNMDYTLDRDKKHGAILFFNGNSPGRSGLFKIADVLDIYGILFNEIYAENVTFNSYFMQPGTDTLTLNTEFVNPNNRNFSTKAIITSMDSIYNDSIPLYDDGNHGDLQAGDGIWGNYVSPYAAENTFMVGINTTDLDSGDYFVLNDLSRFTTIGPVVYDNYEIPNVFQNGFSLRLSLRNDGANATAKDIRAQVSTTDTNVTDIVFNNQYFGDIAPGQIQSSANYIVRTQNAPDTIDFVVSILSEGWHFWSDNFTVVITGLAEMKSKIPLVYSLSQNYPNPFNPTTNIEFSIPQSDFVTLKVYNVLGEEVATLVSERLAAGSYKYDWDAGYLASGVYLYRIQAGDYAEAKKMILLR